MKGERFSKGRRVSGAASWEKKNHLPGGDAWEGLCFAWGMASTQTREPTQSIRVNGVTLSPSDQKALYTKLYQYHKSDSFGVIYRGDAATDGTYQDLRPEAF